MKEIKGKHNTAKVFATTIEESCEQQIRELCSESWTKGLKIRIMADCHSGKGCVIGTTMNIVDKVVPNLVGVDIGCGMLTTKFRALKLDLAKVDKVIRENIPLGRNIRDTKLMDFGPNLNQLWASKGVINFEKVSRSLGTLGGGNHFIEIDKDEDDCYYLVVHSGSRNFGKTVADYYQGAAITYHRNLLGDSVRKIIEDLKAQGLQSQISKVLAERGLIEHEELCYLEGHLFDAYINDMKIAQHFASENRKLIAAIICNKLGIAATTQFETVHNYIDTESMILRKGAISAMPGERCLIPINMHEGSLVCLGKGNEDFNCSAPHGAGRLMSRKAAKRDLSLDEFKQTMEGIYSTTVNMGTLDEAPKAYKPIAEILENIKDTVDVVTHIKPIFNLKAEE